MESPNGKSGRLVPREPRVAEVEREPAEEIPITAGHEARRRLGHEAGVFQGDAGADRTAGRQILLERHRRVEPRVHPAGVEAEVVGHVGTRELRAGLGRGEKQDGGRGQEAQPLDCSDSEGPRFDAHRDSFFWSRNGNTPCCLPIDSLCHKLVARS